MGTGRQPHSAESTAPDTWHWPVGASLSAEVGYQRRLFSQDTWTFELRPIIDKQMGRWYASLNPTVDRALRTDRPKPRIEFSPNAAVNFDATGKINVGLEYYGSLGPLGHFDPVSLQQHQMFVVTHLNVGPAWEVNAGYGKALTRAGDRRLVKFHPRAPLRPRELRRDRRTGNPAHRILFRSSVHANNTTSYGTGSGASVSARVLYRLRASE